MYAITFYWVVAFGMATDIENGKWYFARFT